MRVYLEFCNFSSIIPWNQIFTNKFTCMYRFHEIFSKFLSTSYQREREGKQLILLNAYVKIELKHEHHFIFDTLKEKNRILKHVMITYILFLAFWNAFNSTYTRTQPRTQSLTSIQNQSKFCNNSWFKSQLHVKKLGTHDNPVRILIKRWWIIFCETVTISERLPKKRHLVFVKR